MRHWIRLILAVEVAAFFACSAPRTPAGGEPDASSAVDAGAAVDASMVVDAGSSGPPKPTCVGADGGSGDGGLSCTCPSGYIVVDANTCADIDECARNNGGCSEHAACANTPGSFVCQCDPGYVGDGKSCGLAGAGHAVTVSPTSIDFGLVAVGGPASQSIEIANEMGLDPMTPRDDLVVSQFDLPSSVTALLPPGLQFPFNVAPGQRVSVTLIFKPTSAARLNETLTVHANDLEHPTVSVPLTGDARDVSDCKATLDVAGDGLLFGTVPAGQQSTQHLLVHNQGASDCIVQARVDAPAGTPFSVANDVQSAVVLAAQQTLDVPVVFAPPASASNGMAFTATLDVTVPLAAPMTTTVPLSGTAATTCLTVTPSSLDFGTSTPGCGTRTQAVTFANRCVQAVNVTSVAEHAMSGQLVVSGQTLPVTIPGGSTSSFNVQYVPSAVGSFFSNLVIATNEPGVSSSGYVVRVQGQGVASLMKSVSFSQNPRTDVLFVVDDSGSMASKQSVLGKAIPTFLQDLGSDDFHIAVTTTGTSTSPDCTGPDEIINGRFMPLTGSDRIVVPPAATAAPLLQRNAAVGTNGCGTEQGLEGAYLALSDPNLSGTNSGFLRADAFLMIIIVSDADDQSTRTLDFYRTYFTGLKGDASRFSINVIADTDPNVCMMTGVDTEMSGAARYMDIATQTGGLSRSICELDWTTDMQDLAAKASTLPSSFILPEEAQAASVQVSVDGAAIPAGTTWSYDAATHLVVFTAAPAAGSHIEVTYVPACY